MIAGIINKYLTISGRFFVKIRTNPVKAQARPCRYGRGQAKEIVS